MPRKREFFIFCFLALLVVALKLPSLDLPLDNDSSEHAFFARQMMRGEILYAKYHTGHHLPGIYYTFVLAFKLFGDNPVAPKLLLLPFACGCAWLIYLMGRTFFDERSGILGAIFYTLVSSQVLFSGTTAEMEHFANLPLIATVFLFLILRQKNSSAVDFIWIGVLSAVSILYKIVFIAPLATIIVSLLIESWLERGKTDAWKTLCFRLISIAIGLLLLLTLVGTYFAIKGLWERLMLVFTLGVHYFGDTNLLAGGIMFPRPFGFPLFVMAVNNTPLLVFGLIGTYRLMRRSFPMQSSADMTDFTLALWVIISFASAGLRGGGYEHYALVVLPATALIAASEISHAYQHWQYSLTHQQAFLGASTLTALIVINFFWANFDLYRYYFPYKWAQIFTENSAIQYYPDPQQALVDYIKIHTTPDDFVYVWSDNITLYYSVNRLPPIDILMPYYVSATGPPQRIFDPRTKYIILDEATAIFRPQWLINGLDENYFLETTIGGKELYRRKTI